MLKIALIGTVCSGKTTIIKRLKDRLSSQDAVFIEEVAEEYFNIHRPQNMYAHEVNTEIQELILQREKQAQTRGETIICDRSVLCPAVYSLTFCHTEGYHDLLGRMEEHLSSYKRFFLMDPSSIPYVQKGFRYEDELTRLRIHETYLSVLNDLQLPWNLVTGSKQERATYILNFIERPYIGKERLV